MNNDDLKYLSRQIGEVVKQLYTVSANLARIERGLSSLNDTIAAKGIAPLTPMPARPLEPNEWTVTCNSGAVAAVNEPVNVLP